MEAASAFSFPCSLQVLRTEPDIPFITGTVTLNRQNNNLVFHTYCLCNKYDAQRAANEGKTTTVLCAAGVTSVI